MQHAIQIAAQFADNMRAELSEADFAEMQKRNGTPRYAGTVCASHDFCDANMPMADAFKAVMRRDINLQDGYEVGLWSEAWKIAKALFLSPQSWSRLPYEEACATDVYAPMAELHEENRDHGDATPLPAFIWVSDFETAEGGACYFEEMADGQFHGIVFNETEMFESPVDAARWTVEKLGGAA